MAITCCWIRLQQGELGLYLAHPIGKLRRCPEHFNPPAHAPPERREAGSGGLGPRRPAGGIAGLAFARGGRLSASGRGIFRAFRISSSRAIVSSSCRMSSGNPAPKPQFPAGCPEIQSKRH